MPDSVRYYATSRYAYAWALLRLTELSREHQGPPFVYGPLTLDALETQGMQVAGDDLESVTDLLSRQAGMIRVPD
jgi:hypothetical protein